MRSGGALNDTRHICRGASESGRWLRSLIAHFLGEDLPAAILTAWQFDMARLIADILISRSLTLYIFPIA